ncbi:TolC family protein [Granulicella sp. S156]|uniref:TolC family protein n=1 Tax=Granulicella sp. S156 TaxID=1747224 RepID=UPI00131B8D84|nr:TolC family protein [Granulicella sp. S156]
MKVALYWTAAWVLATSLRASAQDMSAMPTPLAQLIAEAEANNTQISAADHSWKAATHVAQQVTTLPDPQFTVQQFSVGSPKPFAGFSNSDFAYIGLGASQDLPYPGKLRLKGEVANREADTQHAQADVLRSSIAEQIKLVYLRLAYLDATLAILHQNDAVLQPLIQNGLSRYSVGQGSQADVLKAQIEHTKILREVTMHHQEMGQLQADLKQLLHRSQDSEDILPEQLAASPLRYTAEELQALVQSHNPAVHRDANAVQKQDAQLKSAKRDGKPDFNVGYTFEQTGSGYRDYYMLSLNMRLPRRKRVEGEIAEATERLSQSKQELDSQTQQQLAEVQKEYIAVTSTEDLLKEYQEGLIPQANAAFHSEEAAYQSNKQQFAPVLSSLLDVLSFEHDYQQALFDHETALAHLETLTGATLR